MKVCIVRLEWVESYSDYDCSNVQNIIPETMFEDVTQDEYEELLELTKQYFGYHLITWCGDYKANTTIQAKLAEMRALKKQREKEREKMEKKENERKAKLAQKRRERDLKKFEKMKKELGLE